MSNAQKLSQVVPGGGAVPVTRGGTGAATLTGVLKGNGTSAMSAASAGTDFVAPGTVTEFTKPQRPSITSQTTPSSNSVTWDLTTNSVFRVNLNANITTFTLTGTLSALVGYQYQLVVRYNGGTSISWPASFKWEGGTAPTLTGTSSKIDIFNFMIDTPDGSNYYVLCTGMSQNLG
jgi:hypothetical protein